MRHALRHVTDPETGKVYPIPAGGSGNEPPPSDDGGDDADKGEPKPDDGDEPEPLGDKGIKALHDERDARKAAEKRAKAAEDRAIALERGQMDDNERAIAEARDEARKEVLGELNAERTQARTISTLAGQFRNPGLAARLIDFAELDTDDDGIPTTEAISEAGKKLLDEEPGLAANASQAWSADAGRRPGPSGDKPGVNDALRALARR